MNEGFSYLLFAVAICEFDYAEKECLFIKVIYGFAERIFIAY